MADFLMVVHLASPVQSGLHNISRKYADVDHWSATAVPFVNIYVFLRLHPLAVDQMIQTGSDFGVLMFVLLVGRRDQVRNSSFPHTELASFAMICRRGFRHFGLGGGRADGQFAHQSGGTGNY